MNSYIRGDRVRFASAPSSGGFMSFSIWAMRSIEAPSISCKSDAIFARF